MVSIPLSLVVCGEYPSVTGMVCGEYPSVTGMVCGEYPSVIGMVLSLVHMVW